MKRKIILTLLVLLALGVFAGWWRSILLRPGVPVRAKRVMTVCLFVMGAASALGTFAIWSSKKE